MRPIHAFLPTVTFFRPQSSPDLAPYWVRGGLLPHLANVKRRGRPSARRPASGLWQRVVRPEALYRRPPGGRGQRKPNVAAATAAAFPGDGGRQARHAWRESRFGRAAASPRSAASEGRALAFARPAVG